MLIVLLLTANIRYYIYSKEEIYSFVSLGCDSDINDFEITDHGVLMSVDMTKTNLHCPF